MHTAYKGDIGDRVYVSDTNSNLADHILTQTFTKENNAVEFHTNLHNYDGRTSKSF